MFKNTLCTDPLCNPDCAHRGPRGQYCHFDVEKELCEILGTPWEPRLAADDLLRQVRTRLYESEGTSEHLVGKIAERMKPEKDPAFPPQLKAVE